MNGMKEKKGVLIVNLGTPNSPKTSDVRTYLNEFLMDGRVIDVNVIPRFILVKGIIAPFRGPKSAKTYREIWSDEGSPLMVHSQKSSILLQEKLGDDYRVILAMRYQTPSIEQALKQFYDERIYDISVIPLFPQYASATNSSVNQKVMEIVGKWQIIPKISFLNSFHDHPKLINAFAARGKEHDIESYDHILFSFHGLPQRHMRNSDPSGEHCVKVKDCCLQKTENNKYCYSAQCYQTAMLIAEELSIPKEKYTICFQSRLGNDPWIQPYTSKTINELAKQGMKKLLVFCPAFVADCLETVYEVSMEYDEEFKEAGGEKIQLVTGLNDHPLWIETMVDLVHEN